MRGLIRFIIRNHVFLLFVVYLVFSLVFVYQFNNYHRSYFINTVHSVKGRNAKALNGIADYFRLKEENTELLLENKRLRNLLKESWNNVSFEEVIISDTLYRQKYVYTEAEVINTSISRKHNYLTIDKGTSHGVEPDMAVMGNNGIVGIVLESSENFSTVISMLHLNFKVSGKIKKNDYFGAVTWNGKRTDRVSLNNILHHVEIEEGDTIVTTNFSHIFPEGLMIGTITDYRVRGNFYEINLKPSTSFRNIANVYVIKNLYRTEQLELEQNIAND